MCAFWMCVCVCLQLDKFLIRYTICNLYAHLCDRIKHYRITWFVASTLIFMHTRMHTVSMPCVCQRTQIYAIFMNNLAFSTCYSLRNSTIFRIPICMHRGDLQAATFASSLHFLFLFFTCYSLSTFFRLFVYCCFVLFLLIQCKLSIYIKVPLWDFGCSIHKLHCTISQMHRFLWPSTIFDGCARESFVRLQCIAHQLLFI